MSDGASVYECTDANEVVDLLQGGQGMFAIALGGVWKDVEGTIAQLPYNDEASFEGKDELAARRQAKLAAM